MEDSERWRCMQSLFHEAVALPPERQGEFLRSACAGDPALEARIESMLREDALGACILDRNLASIAGELLDQPDALAGVGQIGRYRVLRKLGEGGMGVVYLAEREDLGGLVAIKVLRDSWVSKERRVRFSKEQQFLASLEHASIARLYDADTLADGTPYFVMEYVEGVSLVDHCEQRAASIQERLSLFRAVCEAVQYAHGVALVHRDLKPSNILVKADGSVRLLDFGIAKQLSGGVDRLLAEKTQGLTFMTPAYAAPERLKNGAVGLYTDIYSLGVILYQLLTGRLPFDLSDRTPVEVETILTQRVPAKPSELTRERSPRRAEWADLDVLVLTAMHKEPLRRYRSVDALIRDLAHFSKHEPLEARPDSMRYRLGKYVRRNRTALAITTLVLGTILGLAAFFTVRLTNARNAAMAQVARTQRIESFLQSLFQGGEENAGPPDDLRVVTVIDRGAREARTLDGDPSIQAELFQTLGTIYGDLGRFEQADELFRSALAKRTSSFGKESPEIAETLVAIGLMRVEEARFDEAETLLRKALAIDKQTLPADHPAQANAASALGRVFIGRGDYTAAIPLLEEAARLLEQRGDQPRELSMVIADLANTQYYLGNYAESRKLNLRSIEMDRASLGEKHVNVADGLINLGVIELELGHYAEAERLNRRALPIIEAWFGPNHYLTASNLTLLGRAIYQQGRNREAEELLRRAVDINERAFTGPHPKASITLHDLGSTVRNLGRLDEADADFQRMLAMERALRGNDHERVGLALADLASVACERKDYARGEQLLREALGIYARRLPADHVRVGEVRIALGHALLGQARYADARVESLGGYDILNERASPQVAALKRAREDLAAEFDALGEPQRAARYRTEASR